MTGCLVSVDRCQEVLDFILECEIFVLNLLLDVPKILVEFLLRYLPGLLKLRLVGGVSVVQRERMRRIMRCCPVIMIVQFQRLDRVI